MTGQSSNYPPKGLLRLAYRLPVHFYRMKLGWLLGARFVLINHLGRKTGRLRQTVVEVVERDRITGIVTVVAGYGPQTQWYQNLKVKPEVVIQMGCTKHNARAEFVTPEDGEEIMLQYFNRYGKLTGILLSILGYAWDGTEQGIRQITHDSLRFVRFTPLAHTKTVD